MVDLLWWSMVPWLEGGEDWAAWTEETCDTVDFDDAGFLEEIANAPGGISVVLSAPWYSSKCFTGMISRYPGFRGLANTDDDTPTCVATVAADTEKEVGRFDWDDPTSSNEVSWYARFDDKVAASTAFMGPKPCFDIDQCFHLNFLVAHSIAPRFDSWSMWMRQCSAEQSPNLPLLSEQ